MLFFPLFFYVNMLFTDVFDSYACISRLLLYDTAFSAQIFFF